MTKHNLLTPRFKVIADYPTMERNGNYKVGDILTDDGKTAVLKQDGTPVFACDWKKYPHLFKELKWWEDRELNEMPTYVLNKSAIPNVAIKADKWTWEKLTGTECIILTAHSGDKKHNFNYPYLMPLTEEEFNSFIGGEEKKEENNGSGLYLVPTLKDKLSKYKKL